MNRYTFRVYSFRKLVGTLDVTTNGNKQKARAAAIGQAAKLYPCATVQSV